MGLGSQISSALRGPALATERALQSALRVGGGLWLRAAGSAAGRDAADFRGYRCHCDPALPLHFIHSEALREACDFVVDQGSNVRCRQRPPVSEESLGMLAGQLKPGAAVYVKTDRLGAFETHILPKLRVPVVLVTGDSDASPMAGHGALLVNPLVAHWFAQNCDRAGRHPKLTRVPIGVDNPVFTKLEKRLGFAIAMILGRIPVDASASRNDMGDQALLQRVRAELPSTGLRSPRALCTFHQNQRLVAPDLSHLPEREGALRALRGNPCCHFVPRRLAQEACWRAHGDFAFEVSVKGNGLDCFRTWEALALGSIPIVRRSPLDPLYEDEGLPVALVDDWSEVTKENLARWHSEMAPRFGPGLERKLCAPHWIAKIRDASERVREC
jgi:hypothetical protein